jgi:hypothetical protein
MLLRNNIKEQYPFINIVHYGNQEYVGILVNQDTLVTTFLDYAKIKTAEERNTFLELGSIWWMESNRLIPITIFLKNDIENLLYSLMTMNTKDVTVIQGPIVNLNNLSAKRIKRKSVLLVRKPKK